jgi:hypothetical protein
MWTTLVLATVLTLTPARSETLELKNVRFTYGPLGQERENSKFLGGDILFVSFDIDGLRASDDGQVLYSMGLEVLNKEGKSYYKEEPGDMDGYLALGGNRLPVFTHVLVGTEQPEGQFEIKVTVKDRANGESASFTRKFEVLPREFGLVQVAMTYFVPDGDCYLPAPPVGVVGQRFLVNFTVVGFDLDKARKDQPNVETRMRVLDEDGKATLAKPYSGVVKEIDPVYAKGIPMQYVLQLNRPGRFTIELKATDTLTGKTAQRTLELVVVVSK